MKTCACGCLEQVRPNRTFLHGHNAARDRRKHGFAKKGDHHPLWNTWAKMLDRCLNPRSRLYPNYGGRGITICPRWRESFANFLEDMGERPVRMTLDRIENDGPYDPGNCRWATWQEQRANRRATTYRCPWCGKAGVALGHFTPCRWARRAYMECAP